MMNYLEDNQRRPSIDLSLFPGDWIGEEANNCIAAMEELTKLARSDETTLSSEHIQISLAHFLYADAFDGDGYFFRGAIELMQAAGNFIGLIDQKVGEAFTIFSKSYYFNCKVGGHLRIRNAWEVPPQETPENPEIYHALGVHAYKRDKVIGRSLTYPNEILTPTMMIGNRIPAKEITEWLLFTAPHK